MVEPVTTVGLGAVAAYLGKDGLQKLLGPTADYLGQGLKDFAQKRVENIGRIFNNATEKLGDRIESPGEVPPRVLKAILDEGSFCDNVLAAEYFGGVLASSRTEVGRDDRGARVAKIIDGLSSYQIRTHYLIYSTVKQLFHDKGLPFNMEGRPKMQLFIPFGGYIASMDFNESELAQVGQLLNHILFGLYAEKLIDDDWQYGPKEHMITLYPNASDGGIICKPSALGAELFLNAFGHADKNLEFIFENTFLPVVENIPNQIPGAVNTK